MIEGSQIRRGNTIEIDGTLYSVIEIDHIKMGRGSAQVRMKLRDIRAGHIVDKSAQAGARFQMARVENTPAQYLYPDGDMYNFMDTETFEQFAMTAEVLGDALKFLSEGDPIEVMMHKGFPLSVEVPSSVVP